ncbi:MAG TPA: cation-translocating P-type ATPase [Pelagibacterium sp.]|uniref:heavy metal translocating P-type ATPase n=1 Tax=Pelagibacterium sp. TaxID=1967288 RepID=UPI002D1D08EF|nr:cation-translocating P-type ATPase [Pelagibacterium sp.]HWJ88706.1 cation-translocating P-type ATPase [Pelagibacterium sp.]
MIARIAVAGLCAIAVQFRMPDANPPLLMIGSDIFLPFSWYALVGLLFGGWPLFVEAWESIRRRQMTMELSMVIAILAATYTGYFFVALVITFFVLIAEVLEGMTVERGRRAIHNLLELLPREVSVRRSGAVSTIASADLVVGDTVLVEPGALVAVDGTVVSGNSFVDETRITGESMPVEKLAGTRVYAGSINQSGALEIRSERIGRDTSYGRIIAAIEQAERSRAPVQRYADKLAAYIVYVALFFAVIEYFISGGNVSSTIAVIIVAGACGVAAGTPLAILGAIGRSARLGAIVKGGIHLETLSKVDTIVLDKTGTLTFGKPDVVAIEPADGITESQLLSVAATAEIRSEHPLGKAIMARAAEKGIAIAEPDQFSYVPGMGISASGKDGAILVGNPAWMDHNGVPLPGDAADRDDAITWVHVALDGRALGAIGIADRERPEAHRAMAAFKKMGIRTILLTGDSASVAKAVGTRLGIDDIRPQLLPEHKLAHIRELVGGKSTVAMVGDGVNDTLALAAADVGVAMGSGTEVARESADIVLLGNDLERFAQTVAIARRARGIIYFNFAGTVLIDILGIAAVMLGYVGPVAAVMIHVGSELAFILNSARLLSFSKTEKALDFDMAHLPASGTRLVLGTQDTGEATRTAAE